jgi:pyruvate dehydrogenase E1 component beta subunit
LEAPIVRVAGYDTVIPLPKLEKYYLPSAEKVAKAIEEVIKF